MIRQQQKITATLQASGIHVHFDDSIENIPLKFQQKDDLVVFTPAISKENRELNFSSAMDLKKKEQKFSGILPKNFVCHRWHSGKTTIFHFIYLGHIMPLVF